MTQNPLNLKKISRDAYSLIDQAKQVEDQKKDKRRQERLLNDLKTVLALPEGRRLIWKIMSLCRAFQDSANFETNLAFIEKGKRQIGLWLLHLVFDARPEAFTQMQRESKSEEVTDKITAEQE